MFTVQQFLCEIHVDPLTGTSTSTITLKAACATPYSRHKLEHWWEWHCLGEHTCPLAGMPLGMPSRHVAHASLGGI